MPNTANNIGRRSNSYHYLDGKLSNVQIFNTALTGADVETLYNYGSPIKTLANIPQSSNLKAWYKLDASEAYNNTTTEWSIDNNQNPSAYASSLDFDSASSDYIDCGNNASLYPRTGDMSYSFWVNPDVLSGLQTIYGRTAMSTSAKGVNINLSGSEVRVFMGVGVSGQWGVNTGGGTGGGALITSNSGLTVGQWSHIVLTLDRDGDGVIYINGVAVVTAAMNPNDYSSVDIVDSRSNLIGNGNAYSNVKISNMSVWNTSLTSAQVSELYNNGTPSNLSNHSATSNLISWYKLNNTTTGIEDAKSSNDGTNNGATEYAGFVNTLVGNSSGMSQASLVQSDLQTVAPYSKYAMDFDGTADYINIPNSTDFDFGTADFTWSFWLNYQTHANNAGILYTGATSSHYRLKFRYSGQIIFLQNSQSDTQIADLGTNIEGTGWHHISLVRNSGTITTFLDGSQVDSSTRAGDINSGGNDFRIAYNNILFNGQMSNVSIWNTALTSAQVTEIYNEGLPGNLNSHSAYSNLVSWWQLGENSSFDGNDWIVADEKGTNNGTSVSMPVGALVNGVGTTANGLSSGMSEGNLVGDAPYSTANAISTNMVVTSRVSGSGNTP